MQIDLSPQLPHDDIPAPIVQDVNLNYVPRPWQQECHAGVAAHRYSVIVAHRRSGKTHEIVAMIFHAALVFEGGDGQFAFIAPQLKQAKRIAWKMLRKLGTNIPGIRFNEVDLSVSLPNGSIIYLYGTEGGQAESMRGLYFDGVAIDEYASISPHVYEEIIYPTLQDREGWMVVIGTFRGLNQFHKLYEDAIADPKWFAAKYDVHDTKVFTEAQIEEFKKNISSARFRQEFLCDPYASSDDILLPIDIIIEACNRPSPTCEEALEGLPKVLGVDVARFGDDRSVIAKRHGHFMYKPEVHQGLDNMQLVARIAYIINAWKPDMVFIDGGRGEGVIDRLGPNGLGHDNIFEIQFGGSPSDKVAYKDKRTEMAVTFAEWVKDGGILPNTQEVKRDLSIPTFDYTPAGQIILQSKKKLKEEHGFSTDIFDAMMLTVAMPIPIASKYDNKYHRATHTEQTNHEYDPFAEDNHV